MVPDKHHASSELRGFSPERRPQAYRRHSALWEFAPSTHPYTVSRVGEHLRENEGWITTPELRELLDSGDMVAATAREVVYSVGTKPSIWFPARDLTVRLVGKCARYGDESSIIVRDD